MKNLKISKKLLVSFSIVIVLAILLAGIGIFANTSTLNNFKFLIDYSVQRERYLHDAQYQFSRMMNDIREISMCTGDSSYIGNELSKKLQDDFDGLMYDMDRYDYYNTNDPLLPEDEMQANTEAARSIRNYAQRFFEEGQRVIEAAMAGDEDSAEQIIAETESYYASASNYFAEKVAEIDNHVTAVEYELADQATLMTTALIIITVAVVAASFSLTFYISRLVSTPMVTFMEWMYTTSEEGNATWTKEEEVILAKYKDRRDEVGAMFRSYMALCAYINEVSGKLSEVAHGNLDLDVRIRGENDILSQMLSKMIVDLNAMFADIRSSAAQVTLGSRQVADGAQSLAQGSTEQAASVEELSASIGDIAASTKANAGIAAKTAELSGTIRQNAEKGSRQMDEMMTAVTDINEASQSIGKVIKTIDDIAFQTNILALNAAVEAARAGQHGKGFAVVAEEVRNLASKSADAAKETGDMIQNSITKAELGARIAEETASSLQEIVSGIGESSELISQIAHASEDQSLAISQINTGVDQVAQVVQQNSATAQQSAAASEQMSGQSDMLQELIAQFKLKEGGSKPGELPAPNTPESSARLTSGGDTTHFS